MKITVPTTTTDFSRVLSNKKLTEKNLEAGDYCICMDTQDKLSMRSSYSSSSIKVEHCQHIVMKYAL